MTKRIMPVTALMPIDPSIASIVGKNCASMNGTPKDIDKKIIMKMRKVSIFMIIT